MKPSIFRALAPGGRAGCIGAGLNCNAGKFYCELNQADGSGKFTARLSGGDVVTIPLDKLGVSDDIAASMVSDPITVDDCLLKGIGWVLTKYGLKVDDEHAAK